MSSQIATRPAGSADAANEPREIVSTLGGGTVLHIGQSTPPTQARRRAEEAFAKVCRKFAVVRVETGAAMSTAAAGGDGVGGPRHRQFQSDSPRTRSRSCMGPHPRRRGRYARGA